MTRSHLLLAFGVSAAGMIALTIGTRPTLKAQTPPTMISTAVVAGAFGGSDHDGETKVPPVYLPARAMTIAESKTRLKLHDKIPMNFPVDTPLEDVKKYIEQATIEKADFPEGIPIYVDPQGLQDADKTMASTVQIDLKNMPLETTLGLLLKQVGMTYWVNKDGPPDHHGGHRRPRDPGFAGLGNPLEPLGAPGRSPCAPCGNDPFPTGKRPGGQGDRRISLGRSDEWWRIGRQEMNLAGSSVVRPSGCGRLIGQPTEGLPGVEARGVPVAPDEPDGVAADRLHAFELEVVVNRRGVEDALAGPFVPTGRARAFAPDVTIREAVDAFVSPGQLQDLVARKGPNVARRIGS